MQKEINGPHRINFFLKLSTTPKLKLDHKNNTYTFHPIQQERTHKIKNRINANERTR